MKNIQYRKQSNKVHTSLSFLIMVATILITISSCSKDFLDAKPNKKLALPSTLNDLQALMDNSAYMNGGWPSAGEIAADNYAVTSEAWHSFSYDITSQNLYIWEDNVFNDNVQNEWFLAYQAVFYSNTVLENIDAVQTNEAAQKNNIKGEALFFRAQAFYELAQIFAGVYHKETAASDLGIPLRLTSDINQTSTRSSVEQTYQQIITDLQQASTLLALNPLYKTRPSKPAAYGMLARTFLSMQDYTNAKLYADSCLQLFNTLIDYNTLDSNAYNPLPMFNDEVIFHSGMFPRSIVLQPAAMVDTALNTSYANDDLRKPVFFKPLDVNTYGFYGSYSGSYILFNGIATDEVYLIRAESEARIDQVNGAMQDLNTMLIKRWKAGTFIPYTATDADDALIKILQERRKELIFRGQRWTDLRRLNSDSRFAVTIERKIDDQTYTLQPGDLKYTFLIPQQVIITSHIQQNPR